jgi:hypothetical protein
MRAISFLLIIVGMEGGGKSGEDVSAKRLFSEKYSSERVNE